MSALGAMMSGLPTPLATAIYFLLSLFPLVLAHEIGHFLVAKLGRVRVDEFGVGFPPRLMRLATIGETDYTVNALPLGGFVRLAGEDDPTVPGAFAGRSKRVRAAVLLAGPSANFLLAAAIFTAMAATGLIPEAVTGLDGVRIAQVGAASPAERGGLRPGDVIVAVNGDGLVEPGAPAGPERLAIAVDSLLARVDASADRAMALTVVRGRLATVELDAAAAGRLATTPVDWPGVTGQRVTTASEQVPSLQRGDVLLGTTVAVDGRATVRRAVLRQPELLSLDVTPTRAAAGQPARMGTQVTVPTVPTRYGMLAAATHGVRHSVSLLHAMVSALAKMVLGQARVELAGPVGISILSRQMGEMGAGAFLEFMALLSLNLGVVNLLPVPALDGGRLLFIGAEALRGRRIEPSHEALVHLVGFMLVIGLMGLVTVIEVARLTGFGRP